MEPAVFIDGVCGRLFVVEVALHDIKAPDNDLTRLIGSSKASIAAHDANFNTGNGTTRCLCNGIGRVTLSAHGDETTGFRKAISRDDRIDTERLAHLDDQFCRDCRRPGCCLFE